MLVGQNTKVLYFQWVSKSCLQASAWQKDKRFDNDIASMHRR